MDRVKNEDCDMRGKKPFKQNANSLTKAIVEFLCRNKWIAWRQNNGGVYDAKIKKYRRNPHHKKGVSDIIGFHRKNARFIGVEIKVNGDKASIEQKLFIEDIIKAGGIGIFATSFDQFLVEYNKQIGL